MVVGKRFVLKQHFEGLPKREDFEIVEEELGELQDGEILYQSEYISVDPYQRAYSRSFTPPLTMIGSSVAKIIESKNGKFPVGARIIAYTGWVETGKVNPDLLNAKTKMGISLIPEIGDLSPSLLLGALGMPGNTAYFGLLEICQPKKGETVLVNGAAGAVGSVVGQIAKIKGCKVIAYAGTAEKVAWLKSLNFDHVFNYKEISCADSLKIAAPEGVDCFFDNIGGSDATVVLNHMNPRGRIACCGSISTYNEKEPPMAPVVQSAIVTKELRMEGFLVNRWVSRFAEGIIQLAEWIKEGKLKTKETVVNDFENVPKAFIGLFTGENIGKMVVKC